MGAFASIRAWCSWLLFAGCVSACAVGVTGDGAFGLYDDGGAADDASSDSTTGDVSSGSGSGSGACGPSTCAGCCNGTTCVSTTSSTECGSLGVACEDCTTTGGRCQFSHRLPDRVPVAQARSDVPEMHEPVALQHPVGQLLAEHEPEPLLLPLDPPLLLPLLLPPPLLLLLDSHTPWLPDQQQGLRLQ